jgi:His/Glu/Gln/Arg/opine family amino acid ABC transporter permease subunit
MELLWQGLLETTKFSAASIAISLGLGTLIGVMRLAPYGPLAVFAEGYFSFFRNIPLLIILFFVLHGLPTSPLGLTLSFSECAVVGLAVYAAAYVAGVVRLVSNH